MRSEIPSFIFRHLSLSRAPGSRPALLAALASLVMSATALAQEADSAFLERAALRAANTNCKFLDASEALALDMGYWQARGALLRGNYELSSVNAMQFEAEDYAISKPCEDEALLAATERLKNAFLAFSRTPFMEYSGMYRQWTATRTLTDVWAAHQEDNVTGVRLGLIYPQRSSDPMGFADPDKPREQSVFAVLLPLPKGMTAPSTAHLIVRNPAKEPNPWLGGPFGWGGSGLSIPPLALTNRIFPAKRQIVDAPPYGDGGATPGVLFMFDEKAQGQFEALDPREAVRIDFIPSDRDKSSRPMSVLIEVGDFRAAAAFSKTPRTRPEPQTAKAEAAAVGH